MPKEIVCALVAGGLGVMLSSLSVAAEWELIGSTESQSASIDKSSIITNGDVRKAWFLWDYTTEQKSPDDPLKTYRSAKQLLYFNCAERTMRLASIINYAEARGGGGNVSSTPRTRHVI